MNTNTSRVGYLKSKMASCSIELKSHTKSARNADDFKSLIKPTLVICDQGSEKVGHVGDQVMASLICLKNRIKMLGHLRAVAERIEKVVDKCALKNTRLVEYAKLVERISLLCDEDYYPPSDKSQDNKEMIDGESTHIDQVDFGMKMLKYLDDFVKGYWVSYKCLDALSYFEEFDPSDPEPSKSKFECGIQIPTQTDVKLDLQPSNSSELNPKEFAFEESQGLFHVGFKISPEVSAKQFKKEDALRENSGISRDYLAHFCRSIIREITSNECLKMELYEANKMTQKYINLAGNIEGLIKVCEKKLASSPTVEYARKLYITYSCNRIHNYSSIHNYLKTYKSNYIKAQKEILSSIDQQLREMHLNKATMQKVFNESIVRIKRDAQILMENEVDRSSYIEKIDKYLEQFLKNRKEQWAREKQLMETKVKLDEDILYIEKQYMETIGELDRNIDETLMRQSEHSVKQAKLDADYDSIKKTFDLIMAERFWADHYLEIRAETKIIIRSAAIKIQTWWRNYRVKKILKRKLGMSSHKKPNNRKND